MTDIALQWIDGEADLIVSGADLLADDGLGTAIYISLACERRADDSDALPAGDTDRRGWWGDTFSSVENDRTGSKLWMLWREPRIDATLQRAKALALEALQWLIDDGVASKMVCDTSFESIATLTSSDVRPSDYALVIELQIYRPDGSIESFRFARQWLDVFQGFS